MASRRQERVAQVLKQAISQVILYDMADRRAGLVTVTRVRPSPDLQRAVVYCSVMGDQESQESALAVLRHARGYIQAQIAPRVSLRRLPVLWFCLDEGVKHSFQVSRLLKGALPPEAPSKPGTPCHGTDQDASSRGDGLQ